MDSLWLKRLHFAPICDEVEQLIPRMRVLEDDVKRSSTIKH